MRNWRRVFVVVLTKKEGSVETCHCCVVATRFWVELWAWWIGSWCSATWPDLSATSPTSSSSSTASSSIRSQPFGTKPRHCLRRTSPPHLWPVGRETLIADSHRPPVTQFDCRVVSCRRAVRIVGYSRSMNPESTASLVSTVTHLIWLAINVKGLLFSGSSGVIVNHMVRT